ncbi:MAG: TetR/AcrR family transcriptional regulator [Deltaproteobacteria bacterium]|nr:TetR/AcrR family transcriptional regulator [Deltaproteobacteria bacterium]
MDSRDRGGEVLEAYTPAGSSNIKGAASRAAILDAARTLLGTDGLSGCSLAAVARAAGCSKASILYHFGTRDGLLFALIAEGTNFFLATIEAAFSSYTPGEGGIEDAVRNAMSALFREENLPLLAAERELGSLGHHDPAVAAELIAGVGRLVESIAQFGHSIDLGPDLDELRARAGCMLAATFGQVELWLYSGGGDPAPHREAAIRSSRAIALEGLQP